MGCIWVEGRLDAEISELVAQREQNIAAINEGRVCVRAGPDTARPWMPSRWWIPVRHTNDMFADLGFLMTDAQYTAVSDFFDPVEAITHTVWVRAQNALPRLHRADSSEAEADQTMSSGEESGIESAGSAADEVMDPVDELASLLDRVPEPTAGEVMDDFVDDFGDSMQLE